MKKEKIFQVFDACEPSISIVREYLEHIAEFSPFELLFEKDGKANVVIKLSRGLGNLKGIIIDDFIFYTKGFELGTGKVSTVSADDVFAAAKIIDQNAVPMNTECLRVLNKNLVDYIDLLERLRVFGYEALPLQVSYMPLEHDGKFTSAYTYTIDEKYADNMEIVDFLNSGHQIFFCSKLP